MITSPVTVSAQKNVNLDCGEMLIWGCVGKQTMVSGASDPVYFYLKIDTETYGTGQIKKTSEDGVVSGISFNISGNGVNKTVTTGADGTVDVQLMPGVYTVTEQSIDRYEPQSVQRVTIVSGHTATVTFNNTLKRGSLEIIKNSEDNLVEGVKFHLYGTSLSGLPVDEYAVTDENGVARFENVLISGETPYTVEEVDTAIRYVVPESQTAPIEWEKVTSRSFTNILKKFNVTVTKSDVETGTAQGDASLAGAVYGIYKGEELIDTYTTDENGQFTTDYYICDDDWTVREISPSEGYLLDKADKFIGSFYDSNEVQALFEAAKGTLIEIPIFLGAFYGLRRSEALGLKWDAIDFQNNTITIRHTVTSCNLDGKHIQIAQDTTKTKSSMRTLPLVPVFKEKLLKLKEQQEEYKRVCGRCYNKKYLEYICVDEMGTLISPHYLTASFPKLLEKNNLRHIRFHDLRHSCASLLLANGVPMKQIQEWLGHSDFSTTANVYAHLDYNSKLSSADAMVNGLSGALEVIS